MSQARRRWSVAIAAIAVVLALAANAGSFLVVDASERSDLILVLAGETEHRPARALQLLDQGYGRRVVIDVPAEARNYGFTEVELARKYVQNLPQAPKVEICPIVGLSTRDESHDAEKCLASSGAKTVLIVTSDFHTRRALSTFRNEIRRASFSTAAARDETQFGTHWWNHRQWAKTCVDEWLRLVWWSAVDRWR
jgi:hypothetical protein